MSRRAARSLAWGGWGLFVGLFGLAALLEVAQFAGAMGGELLPLFLGFLPFATVGAVVASRRPDHPIGWLFLAVTLPLAVEAALFRYAVLALLVWPGTLPGGSLAAWLGGTWLGSLSWLLLPWALLLFPTGRLPSRHWRPVAWILALVESGLTLSAAFAPGPTSQTVPLLTNPLGLDAATDVLAGLQAVSSALLLPAVLVATLSVIVRFRQARGAERQQLEWLALATSLWVVALGLLTGKEVLRLTILASLYDSPLWLVYAWLALASMPVSVGIAILRHRLFDIDILIRRTVIYGALTILLGVAYWSSVVLLQRLLAPLTGGSDLAIIGSTLAVWALFQPARRRIQDVVDRRFYRRKYDAARTLEAFSTRLREQTDLDSLRTELLGVVRQTVQPAQVSLWLRPGPRRNG